jgi:hypothetical protein
LMGEDSCPSRSYRSVVRENLKDFRVQANYSPSLRHDIMKSNTKAFVE